MLESLEWMQWTVPTLIVFIGVILMLITMTIWDIRSPSVPYKGFLGVGFTRGERMFLSIVILVGTTILWIAFLPEIDWRLALPVAGVLIFIMARYG